MEELNGRMLAYQLMLGAVIARLANDAGDPLRFVTEFRDEVRAVIAGVRIEGHGEPDRVRRVGLAAADELFSLMKELPREA